MPTAGLNKRDDAESMKNVLLRRATGGTQEGDEKLYGVLRSSLIEDKALAQVVPQFVSERRSLDEFWAFIKSADATYAGRRELLRKAFEPLLAHFEQGTRSDAARPDFIDDIDVFFSKLVQMLMMRGLAREVAILVASKLSFVPHETNYGGWFIKALLPARYYTQLDYQEREGCSRRIVDAASELDRPYSSEDYISGVIIKPDVPTTENWRESSKRWLKGEGINNQGRVRSTNLPSREVDGLLFRSAPEVHLYRAFKDSGVAFAPLPVFLRGGTTYQRIEPDFVVLKDGAMMVVEVDGDTVHVEAPAEADQRTRIFKHEGALIERIFASECDSPEKAATRAARLLAAFDKWRTSTYG